MHPIRYFSEIHASKASQLYGAATEISDSAEIHELRTAINDYPNDYNLHIQLAQALGQQLRYREAIEILSKAVALEPENTMAYRKRAPRYYSTLQFEAAYKDYSFCAAKMPNNSDVLYRLGIACVAMRRYDEAKSLMAQCIELFQSDGEMQVAAIYWYLAAYLREHDENEINLGAAIYHSDMEVGHHFAYKAGAELLCGLKSPEDTLTSIDNTVDDLDYSMIMYGLYIYHTVNGENKAAQECMDNLLARDFYWAGFAYIAAYAEGYEAECAAKNILPRAVPESLYKYLKEHQKLAVAFSGGADSSYLLYAAKACGCTVKGYYVKSEFQPRFELEDARRLAKELGVTIDILKLDVLENEAVRANTADRCYHCKAAIFGKIAMAASDDGFTLLADGTNASDNADDRPGMRALAELSVVSPLRETGITKAHLRECSRMAGLFTWDKPAYACLATRIPVNTEIDYETLSKIEAGEDTLFAMGFTDFRMRVLGTCAKLQFTEAQTDKLLLHRKEVCTALSKYFSDILFDLKPRNKGE